MSKVFAVSEIDAQQTIDRFVSENFPRAMQYFRSMGIVVRQKIRTIYHSTIHDAERKYAMEGSAESSYNGGFPENI